MIGFVVSVRFLIMIGVKHVKNATNLALRVISFQGLKIGNVVNVEISITLVGWSVIVVNVQKVGPIDYN